METTKVEFWLQTIKTNKKLYFWELLTCSKIAVLLFLFFILAMPAHAQDKWPPFSLKVSPSYVDNQITYQIRLSPRTEWLMTDITIKIPIPEGTRFVEASAPPITRTEFDGEEVTFFTALTHKSLKNMYFVVEVTEPSVTGFSTYAWVSWKGDEPGDYLKEDITIDVSEPSLEWKEPDKARVQLEAGAKMINDVITYEIYPRNVTSKRIWDLTVNIKIPEGTTFLATETPGKFVADYDGREVSFSTLELESKRDVGPLKLVVSRTDKTAPYLRTHAWATWKNEGKSVGRSIVAQEDTRTGDIIVRTDVARQVAADMVGDAPFSDYDLTSVAVRVDDRNLEVVFYTAGEIGSTEKPLQFIFYVDSDCNINTGKSEIGRGAEYQVKYKHNDEQIEISQWQVEGKAGSQDKEDDSVEEITEETDMTGGEQEATLVASTVEIEEGQGDWQDLENVETSHIADGQMVAIQLPVSLLDGAQEFCWAAEAKNRTKAYASRPPTDKLSIEDALQLTHYALPASTSEDSVFGPDSVVAVYNGNGIADGEPLRDAPPASHSPPVSTIEGKLAVPLDNGQDHYDISIFSLPDGEETTTIQDARQPNFRFDGRRLLINREGDSEQNLYEIDLFSGTEIQVSDAPKDSFPFYDSWGHRVVYANSELTVGSAIGENEMLEKDEKLNFRRKPFIFVQCGLRPPHLESEPRCRDIVSLGVLVPAGQMGEIQGTHPVWTAQDTIAYKGCNTWVGATSCGIYSVPASSTKGFSNGFIPRQLTHHTEDIPTDTKGDLIGFMSNREGNWEAYVMNLDGSDLRNVSRHPTAHDGLPAISPDSNWIAFISDRGGAWAVWAVPVTGGEAQKLFDLPEGTSWGEGDRAWMNERISWGP